MGFFTTITLSNDAEQCIIDHPERMMEIIKDAIINHKSSRNNNCAYHESIGMHNSAITVQRSRHADNSSVYIHMNGEVTEFTPYAGDAVEMMKRNPDHFNKHLSYLEDQVKGLKNMRKEYQDKMYHNSSEGLEKLKSEIRIQREKLKNLYPNSTVKIMLVKDIRTKTGYSMKDAIGFLESI